MTEFFFFIWAPNSGPGAPTLGLGPSNSGLRASDLGQERGDVLMKEKKIPHMWIEKVIDLSRSFGAAAQKYKTA